VHPEDLPQAKHIFNERRTGERAAANMELRLRKKSPEAPAAHFDTTAIPIEINAMGIYGADTDSPISMENFEGTYGVARDISERKRAEQMIRYQAHHDILTGLPNRALFNDHLKLALSQARRNQQLVGVLFIDLDGFKIVNDTMGHMFGDQLLQSVAERFSSSLRSADTLARIGGDEFMLLVPGLDSAQHTTAVAQKMLSRLKNPFLMDDEEIFIGASIGIAIFPHDGDTIDELVRKADIAMYQAKGKDKGGFRFYSEEMEGATARRLTVESGLRRAVDRGEFSVVYQPQFNAKSGKIIAVEALLRWNHPSGTVVSPLEFVPVAEEAGLIIPIGNWMIDNALHTLANWRLAGLTDIRMALNISAIQLESDDFIETITRILREYEIPGECLEIEITENALVNDLDSAAEKLNKLASYGVSIAIDDFGTGYSSLGQLHRLPINVLKIDRCFVQDMGKDESSNSIVRSIVAMANGLGMDIIAEGVETPYQHQQLMSIHCNNMQGFLYSHPIEADRVPMLLTGSKAINEIFTLQ
jgi:diguanylate cyclase (GGDEF)-like protein